MRHNWNKSTTACYEIKNESNHNLEVSGNGKTSENYKENWQNIDTLLKINAFGDIRWGHNSSRTLPTQAGISHKRNSMQIMI